MGERLPFSGAVAHLMWSVRPSKWSDLVYTSSKNQRRVFYFFFYEILVDSTLATRRIGEQKFSCLQFASSAHNVASEVMETFCIFV